MLCAVFALGIVFGILLHFMTMLSGDYRKQYPVNYWTLVGLMAIWFGMNTAFVIDILDLWIITRP